MQWWSRSLAARSLPRLRSPIYRCERVECLRATPCGTLPESSSNFRRVSAIALPPHRLIGDASTVEREAHDVSARLLTEA